MKVLILFFFFYLLVGCPVTQVSQDDVYEFPIPPPHPPTILPPHPPPAFTPSLKEIQVNRLPHPFNVNGTMPYQVWVDGERLPLNSHEAIAIAESLNLKFVQPRDTAEIHSGEGWIRPFKINTAIK